MLLLKHHRYPLRRCGLREPCFTADGADDNSPRIEEPPACRATDDANVYVRFCGGRRGLPLLPYRNLDVFFFCIWIVGERPNEVADIYILIFE
jgi:hypothetical protein